MSGGKLVRDKVPAIIEKSGGRPVTRIVDGREFIECLKKKILEEAGELAKTKNENQELEEIIDILEAVNAYMKTRDVSVDAAEEMRKTKLRKAGGFDKRIVLEGIR